MGVLSSGGSIIPDVLAFPTAWTTVRKGQLRLSNPYRQLVRTYQEPQSHANRNMSRSSGRHRHPRSHQAEAIAVPFRLSARNRITSYQRVDTMTPSSHRAASLTANHSGWKEHDVVVFEFGSNACLQVLQVRSVPGAGGVVSGVALPCS